MNDQQKDSITRKEALPSDVVAFCELLARIMMRCLREKNPQVMELLSLSSQVEEPETGGNHDDAA
jgi:hypothetical protein